MTTEEKMEYIKKTVDKKLYDIDVETLARYAKKVPDNGTILDIGTCEGGSAFILAVNSLPSVKVYTIDPTPNPNYYNHLKALGLEDRITIYTEKSQDMKWDKPLDLIFDDGLHTYLGVAEDIKIFYPYVKKDWYCMFHDYRLYPNTIGKAILDSEDKVYKRLEIVDNIYIGLKL